MKLEEIRKDVAYTYGAMLIVATAYTTGNQYIDEHWEMVDAHGNDIFIYDNSGFLKHLAVFPIDELVAL